MGNVNRWRGQLGLEAIAADRLDELEQFEVGENPVVLVKLVGELAAGGMGPMAGGPMGSGPMGPFAGGAGANDDQGATPNPPVERESPIKFTTPEGWRASRGTSMSVAAVEMVDGSAKVETTITPAGGELLANVNRWRGQVGLAPFSANELATALEKIEMAGGVSGDYVRLVGAEQAIFGVVAKSGEQTWFIKLSGDAKLAEKERTKFESLVKSIELPK